MEIEDKFNSIIKEIVCEIERPSYRERGSLLID